MSKSLIKEVQDRADRRIREFKEDLAEKLRETDIELELNEPYTFESAPDWVKKLPKEARDAWVKAYNAAHKEYKGDEAKSAATASATIRKMGYKEKGADWVKEAGIGDVYSKTLLSELLDDIGLIIKKAGDGIKGRTGSPAVRHFLKEVKEKVKNMIARIQDKETKTIAEAIVDKIEEATKDGSFEDIEVKIRAAIKASTWFPEKIGERYAEGPYIRDMFMDRCIVSYESRLYEVSYGIVNQAVVLGQPKEVKEIYVPVKEAGGKARKEPASTAPVDEITDIRESKERDFTVSTFVSLKEAKFNTDFSEVEVVLVEAGCNEAKKRYYPDKTIKEAALIFNGWKNYIDHPTPSEERERPERSLKNWASTITESWYSDGKAMAKIAVHDTWLKERLADPVAREHIGLSILAGGKISVGRVNGIDGYEIVEAIIPKRKNGLPSVDWVTEAGARGRVSRLLESKTGGEKMELEVATIQEVKEFRKDLVEAITREAQAGNTEKQAKFEKDLKEANEKIAAFDKTRKIAKQVELAEAAFKDKKFPESVKERILAQVKAAVIEGEDASIKESIGKMIQAELDYVNKFSSKGKIKTGTAGDTDVRESLQGTLDARAGVAKKETENK